MIGILISSVADHGFKSRSSQTKDYSVPEMRAQIFFLGQ